MTDKDDRIKSMYFYGTGKQPGGRPRTALQHLAWSFDIDTAHRTLLTDAEWQRDGSKLELMQWPLAPWDPKVFAPDGSPYRFGPPRTVANPEQFPLTQH
jgi:hypothetical protein